MSKQPSLGAMNSGKDHKNASKVSGAIAPAPTHPNVPEVQHADVNRGVTANGNMNKHRGDRRDMSKTYTNNERHAARGNNARKDVSTRAR